VHIVCSIALSQSVLQTVNCVAIAVQLTENNTVKHYRTCCRKTKVESELNFLISMTNCLPCWYLVANGNRSKKQSTKLVI